MSSPLMEDYSLLSLTCQGQTDRMVDMATIQEMISEQPDGYQVLIRGEGGTFHSKSFWQDKDRPYNILGRAGKHAEKLEKQYSPLGYEVLVEPVNL